VLNLSQYRLHTRAGNGHEISLQAEAAEEEIHRREQKLEEIRQEPQAIHKKLESHHGLLSIVKHNYKYMGMGERVSLLV
jgi:hypothetical protein